MGGKTHDKHDHRISSRRSSLYGNNFGGGYSPSNVWRILFDESVKTTGSAVVSPISEEVRFHEWADRTA